MKHAGSEALEALEALAELLQRIRTRTALVERRSGIFYVRGKAFLHFHEDRTGLFADLQQRGEWRRLPVNNAAECAILLAAVDDCLSIR
jgi:hypothetical protein